MSNRPIPEIKQLPIWNRFKAMASPYQVANVETLVGIAKAKLIQVRDTFPTYTLHDHEHADNVLFHMGQLLGEEVNKLSSLEAALLILSAYFHDTGMAYTESERLAIHEEVHFEEFLNRYPEARLIVTKTNSDLLPDEIVEWYCRWRHADRIFNVLEEIDESRSDLLLWGTHDIRRVLADLCLSHNLDTAALKDDVQYPVDFRSECDLRFCAILLRLADILDFDRSRSPEQLYQDLGLKKRQDRPGKTSDLEWRKHLNSEGFEYPQARTQNYQLYIKAGPDTPAIEYDIRKFMDVIEEELIKCAALVHYCSDKWRKHPLPGNINRSYICGKGYTYGEHRFILDQREVLQLLMGEKLYKNPYVFIRELIQNALDTSRHREFYERSNGNPNYKCKEIEVSNWVDANGHHWVRIEDFGMGMTEQLINNFLLKVGKSYYNSAQFEANVIHYTKRTGDKFKPISQFGIGLLSCFIIGDRVEISTWHTMESNCYIRLSLSGVQDFFTLQKYPNTLSKMPAPNGQDSGKRKLPGTTICVRLDPRKNQGVLNIINELEDFLFCPEIPVLYEGVPIGGIPEKLLYKAWCNPSVIPLSMEDTVQIGEILRCELTQPISIDLFPIDLTKHAATPLIQGQMIGIKLHESSELLEKKEFNKYDSLLLKDGNRSLRIQLRFGSQIGKSTNNSTALYAIVEATFSERSDNNNERNNFSTSCAIELTSYLPKEVLSLLADIESKFDRFKRDKGIYEDKTFAISIIAHNGVLLPISIDILRPKQGFIDYEWFDTNRLKGSSDSWGVIMLRDDLRPNITISRDKLIGINWNIESAITLTARRAIIATLELWNITVNDISFADIILREYGSDKNIQLGELLKDELLTREDMWFCEKLYSIDDRDYSFHDKISNPALSWYNNYSIHDILSDPALINKPYYSSRYPTTYSIIKDFLVHCRLEPFLQTDKDGTSLMFGRKRIEPISAEEKLFAPLLFVPYTGDNCRYFTFSGYTPYNKEHHAAQWFIKNSLYLYSNYPGIFIQLYNSILELEEKKYEALTVFNRSLDLIGRLNSQISPPRNVYINIDDINIDDNE